MQIRAISILFCCIFFSTIVKSQDVNSNIFKINLDSISSKNLLASFKKDSTFRVKLSRPNGVIDENQENNSLTSIATAPLKLPTQFILKIHTNNVERAKENMFTISSTEGEVYFSDSNFEDDTDYNYNIKLKKGCYQFLLADEMEDGISVHWWYRNSNPELIGINGSVQILSIDGEKLYNFNPDFGEELQLNFIVD